MLRLLVLSVSLVCIQAAIQTAVVVLKADGLSGKITFTQTDTGVQISGQITGLSPGNHGFHIHECGDLSNGCTSAGAHLNPTKMDHGAPSDANRHVGDLGNIEANAEGVATIDFSDKIISLEGVNGIVGRALVVHEKPDDLGKGGFDDSKTTGHAGSRVACGVIGIGTGSPGGSASVFGASALLIFVTNILLNRFFL